MRVPALWFGSLLVVLCCGTLFVACHRDDDDPPSTPVPHAILGLVPLSGHPNGGEVVAINGTGFSSGSTVTFAGNAATLLSATPTLLTLSTPPGAAGSATVAVTASIVCRSSRRTSPRVRAT